MVRIAPSSGAVSWQLRELWQYRELLYFLTWRDVKVRYKQTALGAAWAVLQPLMTMVVFSLFFGRLARMPSDGVPYPIYSFAALVPWTFFSNGLSQASNSLVGNANLLKKVYFPRLAMPISGVLGSLVDFGLAMCVLFGMMLWYGVVPGWGVVLLPLVICIALLSALGAGCWLSALNVRYRDVRYVLPFLTQIWMFLTPIAYPSSIIPAAYRPLVGLNPMAGVVDGLRWALLGRPEAPWAELGISAASAVGITVLGVRYFRRVERLFADVV